MYNVCNEAGVTALTGTPSIGSKLVAGLHSQTTAMASPRSRPIISAVSTVLQNLEVTEVWTLERKHHPGVADGVKSELAERSVRLSDFRGSLKLA